MVTVTWTQEALAKMIDHTLIRADVTQRDLGVHCEEALRYGFAAVAVSPSAVRYCAEQLAGSMVGISALVAFPLGQATMSAKIFEAQEALENGATEIEFVVNIGAVKDGNMCYAASEIRSVVQACGDRPCKVILETGYLTDIEKKALLEMSLDAGATFVRTATGLGPKGATMPDVLLLRSLSQGRINIEAAGGIRTLDEVLGYLDAGCERIGTDHAVSIMREAAEALTT
ncbi:MAG: deoxyribose-phosphate aldolase [Chloroflexi bacterium]|nr:deoxyribose-phosphate aldolase [Chloroflexota bacterium]